MLFLRQVGCVARAARQPAGTGSAQTSHLFSYVSPEQRVAADHPLRAIRALTDEALRSLSPRFAGLYAKTGAFTWKCSLLDLIVLIYSSPPLECHGASGAYGTVCSSRSTDTPVLSGVSTPL